MRVYLKYLPVSNRYMISHPYEEGERPEILTAQGYFPESGMASNFLRFIQRGRYVVETNSTTRRRGFGHVTVGTFSFSRFSIDNALDLSRNQSSPQPVEGTAPSQAITDPLTGDITYQGRSRSTYSAQQYAYNHSGSSAENARRAIEDWLSVRSQDERDDSNDRIAKAKRSFYNGRIFDMCCTDYNINDRELEVILKDHYVISRLMERRGLLSLRVLRRGMLSRVKNIIKKEINYPLFDMFTVKLNNKVYCTFDSDVVRLGNRYYHSSDPKVTKTYNGSYEYTKNVVKMFDGEFAHKDDVYEDVVTNDGEGGIGVAGYNCFMDWTTETRYSNDHKDIIKIDCPEIISRYGSSRVHKSKCSRLNNVHYNGEYYLTSEMRECAHNNMMYKSRDTYVIHDYKGESHTISKFNAAKFSVTPVLYIGSLNWDIHFQDSIKYFVGNHNPEDIEYSEEYKLFYLKNPRSGFIVDDKVLDKVFSASTRDTKWIYSNISYSKPWKSLDFTKTEPVVDRLKYENGDITGGNVYHNPSKYTSRSHFSQSLSKTGGLGYTFGLEHESCVGQMPDIYSEMYGLTRVGDGSTRFEHIDRKLHYEYVTSVLHGDIGVNRMYEYLDVMKNHVIQNNKCSTHIHVGGNKLNTLSTDSPVFNRRFSAYAIALGIQVEDSLAALMPGSRNPENNRYCGTIKHFDKICDLSSKGSINKLIASFVFEVATLDRSFNTKTSLSKWANSRYKWLNLVNCNSTNGRYRNSSFSTIEFRIFPPTLDPVKVHFWILISQAFVWFVENRQRMIEEGGVTIELVLEEAFKGHNIYNFVQQSLKDSKDSWY